MIEQDLNMNPQEPIKPVTPVDEPVDMSILTRDFSDESNGELVTVAVPSTEKGWLARDSAGDIDISDTLLDVGKGVVSGVKEFGIDTYEVVDTLLLDSLPDADKNRNPWEGVDTKLGELVGNISNFAISVIPVNAAFRTIGLTQKIGRALQGASTLGKFAGEALYAGGREAIANAFTKDKFDTTAFLSLEGVKDDENIKRLSLQIADDFIMGMAFDGAIFGSKSILNQVLKREVKTLTRETIADSLNQARVANVLGVREYDRVYKEKITEGVSEVQAKIEAETASKAMVEKETEVLTTRIRSNTERIAAISNSTDVSPSTITNPKSIKRDLYNPDAKDQRLQTVVDATGIAYEPVEIVSKRISQLVKDKNPDEIVGIAINDVLSRVNRLNKEYSDVVTGFPTKPIERLRGINFDKFSGDKFGLITGLRAVEYEMSKITKGITNSLPEAEIPKVHQVVLNTFRATFQLSEAEADNFIKGLRDVNKSVNLPREMDALLANIAVAKSNGGHLKNKLLEIDLTTASNEDKARLLRSIELAVGLQDAIKSGFRFSDSFLAGQTKLKSKASELFKPIVNSAYEAKQAKLALKMGQKELSSLEKQLAKTTSLPDSPKKIETITSLNKSITEQRDSITRLTAEVKITDKRINSIVNERGTAEDLEGIVASGGIDWSSSIVQLNRKVDILKDQLDAYIVNSGKGEIELQGGSGLLSNQLAALENYRDSVIATEKLMVNLDPGSSEFKALENEVTNKLYKANQIVSDETILRFDEKINERNILDSYDKIGIDIKEIDKRLEMLRVLSTELDDDQFVSSILGSVKGNSLRRRIGNKVDGIVINSVLSSPKTTSRIVTGGMLNLMLDRVNGLAGAALLNGSGSPEGTQALTSSIASIAGLFSAVFNRSTWATVGKAFKQGKGIIGESFLGESSTTASSGLLGEIGRRNAGLAANLTEGTLGVAQGISSLGSLVGRSISAADEVTQQIAVRSEFIGRATTYFMQSKGIPAMEAFKQATELTRVIYENGEAMSYKNAYKKGRDSAIEKFKKLGIKYSEADLDIAARRYEDSLRLDQANVRMNPETIRDQDAIMTMASLSQEFGKRVAGNQRNMISDKIIKLNDTVPGIRLLSPVLASVPRILATDLDYVLAPLTGIPGAAKIGARGIRDKLKPYLEKFFGPLKPATNARLDKAIYNHQSEWATRTYKELGSEDPALVGRAVGRMVTSTTFWLTAASIAANLFTDEDGYFITAELPSDPRERAIWDQAGYKPYSVGNRVGGKVESSYEYRGMGGPAAILELSANAAAYFHDSKEDDPEIDEEINTSIIGMLGQYIYSKSFGSAIDKMSKAGDIADSEPNKFLNTFIRDSFSALMPAGAFQSGVRDALNDEQSGNRIILQSFEGEDDNSQLLRIMSDTLKERSFLAGQGKKYGAFGEVLTKEGTKSERLSELFSPIKTSGNGDPVYEALKSSGAKIGIGVLKTWTFNKTTANYNLLDPAFNITKEKANEINTNKGKSIVTEGMTAFDALNSIYANETNSEGHTLKQAIGKLIKQDNFKSKPKKDQKLLIEQIAKNYTQGAWNVFVKHDIETNSDDSKKKPILMKLLKDK